MFRSLPKSQFEIFSPEGQSRGTAAGIYAGETIIIPDTNIVILAGDEMRRQLPNGTDETFEVVDPRFQEKTFSIQAHFQVKIRRKGAFPHNTGGHLNISVSGPNARVNIASTDNSVNTVHDSSVLNDLRGAIMSGVTDGDQRRDLIDAIDEMEERRGSTGFAAAYQKFIGLAADHLGVIGPFLPALAGLLS